MIRYKGKLCAVMLCFIALQFTTPGVTEAVADNSKEQGSPCSPLKIMLVDAWRESAEISLATAEDGQAGEYTITAKYALGGTKEEKNIDSADAQYIDRKGREFFLKIDPVKLAAAEDMIFVEFVKTDKSCTKNSQSLSLFTKHTFRFDFGASMELDQKGAFNNKPQLAFSSRSKVRDWVLAGFDLRYTYYSDSEGGSAAPEQKTQEENAARLFSSNLAEPAPADPGPADAFKQSGGRFELSWFLGAALKNWESSTFPVFGMNFVSEPNKDTNGSVQSASNYFLAYRFRVDRYGSLVGGTMTNANGWVQGGIKSTNIAWDEPFKLSSGKVFIEGEMDAYGGESSKLRLRLLAEVPMDKERQVDGLTNDTRIFISFLWSFDPLESRVFSRD